MFPRKNGRGKGKERGRGGWERERTEGEEWGGEGQEGTDRGGCLGGRREGEGDGSNRERVKEREPLFPSPVSPAVWR